MTAADSDWERRRLRSVVGRIQFDAKVYGTFRRFAQIQPDDLESGGVMMGRRILATEDVVVDHVTSPGPRDQRTRLGFLRRRESHQCSLDRAWQRSNGTSGYLGEWHTHPEACPHPSVVDRANWALRLLDTRVTDPLFFVIVGTKDIEVWESRRHWGIPRFELLGRSNEDQSHRSGPSDTSGRWPPEDANSEAATSLCTKTEPPTATRISAAFRT